MTAIKNWPADQVERRLVADLVPYARNARTHSPEQVAQIARSIEEFGWTIPVLVDEQGGLIAGHGRILAAKKLGLVDVPTMVARGWSDAQKRAYVIADNKLALNAGWDEDLLKIEIGDLSGLGFDVSLTGFDAGDIATLVREPSLTDPDDVPPVQPVAVTRPGDVWLLGAYFECEECGKTFTYEQGRALGGECNCGGV